MPARRPSSTDTRSIVKQGPRTGRDIVVERDEVEVARSEDPWQAGRPEVGTQDDSTEQAEVERPEQPPE